MESCDSSPNYMRATSSFDAKKDTSPGGSECDDIVSVTSSTCGSTINGPYVNKNGNKYRSSNKKTLKSFGNVRSFRIRVKSRIMRSSIPIHDEDSLVESPHSSPHYLKATTCSQGKKTHSNMSPHHCESTSNGSERNYSHKSFQTVSRPSGLKNVRVLIKRSSFKPKRSLLNHSKVAEDVAVGRATYSSTVKDSKFHEPVELHSGGTESEESSAMKVCRYHHCSLHGHCRGSHDPEPPLKRFLYKRRRSLKKQRSIVPRPESRLGVKNFSGEKKNNPKRLIVPVVEPLNQERISEDMNQERISKDMAFSGDEYMNVVDSHEAEPFGDGYKDIHEAFLVEVAFGEMSFPERSYRESVDVLRKYSSPEQDFGRIGSCLRCSYHNEEEVTSIPSRANEFNIEIPRSGSTDVPFTSTPALSKKANEASSEDCAETPVAFDEVAEKNSAFSSASYSQTSSDSNSVEEVESTIESTTTGDSEVNEVVQVEDSETNSPVQTGSSLQFSKPRHISMWHLIHQHMSPNVAVEPTDKPVQGADGESPVDGADSLLAKESSPSSKDSPDSDTGGVNNGSETQEIEIRKLFAIKLVREAIEKILLPEVQDQTSDDQSVASDSTPRPEIVEKNQSKKTDAEGREANLSSDPKEGSVNADDASSGEIKEAEKQVVRKAEKKAPKHWSNLKKWILLQRFIRELEKVRKFNPRKPRHVPLNPDPEAEKVNLRPQTVDGRKSAEEWMLDYALRQAVSQLAPTQKRKVSLLVKAFETVVPSQEDSQVQFRSPRLRNNGLDVGHIGFNIDESIATVPILLSIGQETSIKMPKETEKVYDHVKDKAQSSNRETIGELPSHEKPMPALQGLQGDAASDSLEGKAKDSGQSNKMDPKNHIKMWHMIYQHVVSGIAEKVGRQLLDGSEDDEAEENGDSNDFSRPNDDSSEENHALNSLRGGLTKSNALKLVKEAVDEILLPEVQDDLSDTQSVTSESVQESEEGQDSKGESQVIRKHELPKPKNWSKLKRLILLKRSIKALEKARTSKPLPNQLVPQTPDPEPEKVDLRSQMMDEKKKAEQWMLDYAVQHIVTKLTPARKRMVSMLVEAFEAVVPLPEV